MSEQQTKHGDNSVTDKGVFLSNAGELIRIDQQIKELAGEKAQAVARAKTCGIDVEAAKIAIKLTRGSDTQKKKRLETHQQAVRYAAMLNAEAVTQFEMFSAAADEQPESRDGQIFQEGREAGLQGHSGEAPIGYGNTDQQHWLDGYDAGKAERDRVFAMQAQAQDDEADDDLDDDDLPDDEEKASEDAPSEASSDTVITNVTTFKREVEAEVTTLPAAE